ncbi:11869_t:CDS:2, partial [Funneliformis mosseae]
MAIKSYKSFIMEWNVDIEFEYTGSTDIRVILEKLAVPGFEFIPLCTISDRKASAFGGSILLIRAVILEYEW